MAKQLNLIGGRVGERLYGGRKSVRKYTGTLTVGRRLSCLTPTQQDELGLTRVQKFFCFHAIYLLKNCVFWDVTLCGSCKNRRFGGT
jgi:hypothetical protein